MRKIAPWFLLALLVGCNESPPPAATRVTDDPKLTEMKKRIEKTSPEGKAMLEKVKAMKPEVNEQLSGKTLGELVDIFSKEKGQYNITPIGWEASQKSSNRRWRIQFHYQDYQKQYDTAEWEYNEETNKLYPFDMKNAPGFWVAGEKDPKAVKKK